MPFNGSGVFVRLRNWVNDAAANIRIRADFHDSEDDNFASGLSQCITKDGQTTVTANLPMSNFRHTGVGAATAITHYARYDQLQLGKAVWADAGGTADAITASYSPNTITPVDGQLYFVRAGFANTSTTPTFAPDGTTARTIVKYGNQALLVGDIAGDGHELILRYRLSDTKYELLNPADPGFALLSANNTFTGANTFSGVTTFSTRINTAKGADIASASTVNIGAATGNYIDITGTTTITAFDSVAAGAIRILKFEGILTLTHNATSLILPTGANITTAVGDVAVFVSEGSGNWRCLSYARADGRPLVDGVTTFTSTNQTITAAGSLTIAHGLGAVPFMVYVELICQTSEHNYSVNDVLPVGFFDTSGSAGGLGVSVVPDATNLNIRYGSGSGGNVFLGVDKTSGVTVVFTNGNWQARFKAVRF